MNIQNNRYQVDFENTIEKYSDMVYRIAMTITENEEDAKDVFQETFLRLVKNQDKITGEEHLKAWLIRVVSNCAKTTVSSPWNKNTQGIDEEVKSREVVYIQEENDLLSKLQQLGKKYALPLYLFYYEGYSIKEIGVILEKNENSVKTLLSRGRKLLKKRLQEGEDSLE